MRRLARGAKTAEVASTTLAAVMFEDDDEVFGGPPPDPSQREWRHPSEVAAAAAAAARLDALDDTPPRRWPSPTILMAGSAGLAACIVAVSLARPLFEADPINTLTTASIGSSLGAGPTLDDADSSATAAAIESALTATTVDSDGADTDTAASNADASNSDASNSAASNPADVGAPQTPTIDAATIDPSTVRSQQVSVSASIGGPVIANGLVWGDHVITSAAALDGAQMVSLDVDGQREIASLIGTEPFSDLAVLARPRRATDDSPDADPPAANNTGGSAADIAAIVMDAILLDENALQEITSDTGAATVPVLDPDGSTADEHAERVETQARLAPITGELAPSATIHVIVGDEAYPGRVLTGTHDIVTIDGHTVLGAQLTTVRADTIEAGAIVLDHNGTLAGMTIATDGSLVAIVPMDRLAVIAASLIESGWGRALWMGIEAVDVSPGIELTHVEADSPAAAAGLRPGDVIHRLGETSIPDMVSLAKVLERMQKGDRATVLFERNGQALVTMVKMAGYPVEPERPLPLDAAAAANTDTDTDTSAMLSEPVSG